MELAEFNAAPRAEAEELLRACLDIPEWVDELADARPYPDRSFLQARADAAADAISWEQVAGALARHPRIGEKKAAAEQSATEAAWSASEQAGVAAAGSGDAAADADAVALASGNAAYELRFGYIFLICATGMSTAEIVGELHRRINNTPQDEQVEVMRELREIAALRLAKAVT